ncbi:MAG: hypothetical protein PHF86_02825 [Candidatus Nanoarchaeia archaeon]|jgi:hypothetical protein|nr:hypothetical protein [Candidatus Nanoarchaeia archaeon]
MINKGRKCLVKSCENGAFCKGYCSKHYQQIKFNGKIKEENNVVVKGFCKNLGCGQKVFAKGLCQSCYTRSRLSGNKNGI